MAGIVLLGITANAQDKGLQGTWWAAGQVSFSSQTKGDAKETSNMILPIVGYFVAPSVTVGVGIGDIASKTVNSAGVTTAEANTFVLKPLVRKYWNVKGNLFFYGQAALPVMLGKIKLQMTKQLVLLYN